MSSKKVVILIPIYKNSLTDFEKISLQQVDRMLYAYTKIYIASESLNFNYGILYDTLRFEDRYFVSTDSYSELLMSKKFYETFSEYEYMLIYQLDAFVFKNNLEWFCSMNYDYIGAPVQGGNWSAVHVGNGGLSLRKANRCINVLKYKDAILERINNKLGKRISAEDLFWGYCGNDKDIEFNVPSPRVAAMFSVQSDYVRGLRDIKIRGLPFGCHY